MLAIVKKKDKTGLVVITIGQKKVYSIQSLADELVRVATAHPELTIDKIKLVEGDEK